MGLSDERVAQLAVGNVLGGYENVAVALGYLSYLLAINPEIQEKLQKEIDEYFQLKPVRKCVRIKAYHCLATIYPLQLTNFHNHAACILRYLRAQIKQFLWHFSAIAIPCYCQCYYTHTGSRFARRC